MNFNSLGYVVFLIIVCLLAYKTTGISKKVLFLIANLMFFSFNDLSSLLVLLLIILLTYVLGRVLESKNKLHNVIISVLIVIIPLLLYKYLNFFISILGMNAVTTFNSIPIGLSFYTFASLGYLIDIYKKRVEAEHNILDIALFLSMFFYYGGPIGRAKDLLSQIKKIDTFGKVDVHECTIGCRQMLLGCFMKVFVSESIAVIVNPIYSSMHKSSSIEILIATILFGMQLYCDFGGYSLMAEGSANCLNVKIISNFNVPYMSVSISDFWRRWHISLSTWFRDYVYIPLGGSRCSKFRKNINTLITFTLSGLWHGANWTYVIWGALNGIYLNIESALNLKSVNKKGKSAFWGRIYTFVLIHISWTFFRANSVSDAIFALKNIFYYSFVDIFKVISSQIGISQLININASMLYNYALAILGYIIICVIDIYQYKHGRLELNMNSWSKSKRNFVYVFLGLILFIFGAWTSGGNFIYLNF